MYNGFIVFYDKIKYVLFGNYLNSKKQNTKYLIKKIFKN